MTGHVRLLLIILYRKHHVIIPCQLIARYCYVHPLNQVGQKTGTNTTHRRNHSTITIPQYKTAPLTI